MLGLNDKSEQLSDATKAYLSELTNVQGDLQRLSASSNQSRDAQQYASRLLSGTNSDSELYKSTILINTLVRSAR